MPREAPFSKEGGPCSTQSGSLDDVLKYGFRLSKMLNHLKSICPPQENTGPNFAESSNFPPPRSHGCSFRRPGRCSRPRCPTPSISSGRSWRWRPPRGSGERMSCNPLSSFPRRWEDLVVFRREVHLAVSYLWFQGPAHYFFPCPLHQLVAHSGSGVVCGPSRIALNSPFAVPTASSCHVPSLYQTTICMNKGQKPPFCLGSPLGQKLKA